MTSKDDNRTRWPELAEVVDAIRPRGGIQAVWVEDDETGAVLAGKRPPRSYTAMEFEPEAVLAQEAALEELRRYRENNRMKLKRNKR